MGYLKNYCSFVINDVQIAMLSWWQRKAASAFVAEPPTSSIEEALENFLKVKSMLVK